MSQSTTGDSTAKDQHDPFAHRRRFNPEGFLVAILEDADEAARARNALGERGFAGRDLKVYTGQEILADQQRSRARQSLTSRAVARLTDDVSGTAQYLAYAREGHAALWVHVPDDTTAARAIRSFADHHTVHIRYYGHRRRLDYHMG